MAKKPERLSQEKRLNYAFTVEEGASIILAISARASLMASLAKKCQDEGKEDAAKILRSEVDMLRGLHDDMALEFN